MSYIARLTGIAQYNHKQPQTTHTDTPIGTPLTNVINKLQQYEFIDSLNQITITPNITTPVNNTTDTVDVLFIPLQTFRNLGRNTNIILDTATTGSVIGTSCDVSWHGFIDYANKENTSIQLDSWITPEQQKDKPTKSASDLDSNWHNNYSTWQTKIENKFIKEKQNKNPYNTLLQQLNNKERNN